MRRKLPIEAVNSQGGASQQFNILWANTETICLLYTHKALDPIFVAGMAVKKLHHSRPQRF